MKRKNRLLSLLSGVLAVLMLLSLGAEMSVATTPVTVSAASSSELKEELEDLQDQKKDLQEQMAALSKDIEANLTEIQRMVAEKNIIDQEIGLLSQQIANVNEQITTYGLLIADKQDELDAAQQRLDELTAANKERIRAMEENGSVSYWAVIFEANSFTDLLDRVNMIREISEADTRRLAEMSEAAKVVEQAQQELSEEKAALEETRAELDEIQKELESKRSEMDRIIAELKAQGQELDDLMDAAEDEESKILQEIAKKEQEINDAIQKENPPVGGGGGGQPGDGTVTDGITWLVPCYYTRVSSPFGWRIHPVYGTRKMHYGIDLAAPQGTPIYATRGGTVTIAVYSSTAGYYVSLNHGDGFSSVYMHMTHYVVYAGQTVEAGQLLGYVGSTGTSTGPHLHFGIAYNGEYVNPADYIDF